VGTGNAQLNTLPDRPPAMSYSSCYELRNPSQTATYALTFEMEALGGSGEIYPTVLAPREDRTLGRNGAIFGCGGSVVWDFDFSHPIASRYRLRIRYQGATGSGVLEGTGAMTSIHQLPPRVVINEFRTRGPNGSRDQFVELFNDSVTPSNAALEVCGSASTFDSSTCVSLPITIGPLCHYLLAGPGYSGQVRGDSSMPAMLHDDGDVGVRLAVFSGFTQNDKVGMNAALPSNYEGAPLPPFGSSNTDRAYVRIGTDTNNNERDFVMRSPASPQNATFCGTR
jgi:hypothetical protein